MTARSAIGNATPWLTPIGRPKAVRVFAYAVASSRMRVMRPSASALIAMRPSSRVLRNWRNPWPRRPSRWSSGTRHPENDRPWVSEMFQPSLS